MKRRRRVVLVTLLAVVALLLAYLLVWPTSVEPVAWSPPPAPALTGEYQANALLSAVEVIAVGDAVGPEDIAVDAEGRLYAGYADGAIRRWSADGDHCQVLAQTGGRPLGLALDHAGNLIVADAYRGLLAVSPEGSVTELVTTADGVPFRFTNDVDIADDGTIFFTDSSSKFGLDQLDLEVLESGANGRLLAYDPATQSTRVLLDGLHFANGVAVSADQSFVLVVETSRYRVLRFWLAGPKRGQVETWLDNLPGFPDGISSDGNDGFWLALYARRDDMLDAIGPHPWLRKAAARLPAFMRPDPPRYAFVLGLNRHGRVVRNLQDGSDNAFAPIASVQQHGHVLYLGGTKQRGIGRLPLPAPAR